MKILVADDSKTNLALITASLHQLGHEVISALNGDEAIELFTHEHPDLIILDVVMEGMDGFECAQKIRALEKDDWIPIIFLSSSVDDVNIAKGISAGGDDYLAKPFSEITLEAKIKAMQRIAEMRKKLYATTQELRILSGKDPLTHTYNRMEFEKILQEKLSEADRNHYLLGIMFIDLDNFKTINDTFGHHTGDLLLVEVANRIRSNLRLEDSISRIGGDEFIVLLSHLKNSEQVSSIAEKIRAALVEPYDLNNHIFRISSSIGIAIYPQNGNTKKNILQNADLAMYHAKELGKNNYQFFSQQLNEQYKQKITIEQDLQLALEQKDLFIIYQPIFDLHDKQIIGVEPMLRWQHREYGLLLPETFIPVAEESGLITQVGNWFLDQVIAEAMKWYSQGYKELKIFITLSLHQLLQDNFINQLENRVAEIHFPSNLIHFQLPENICNDLTVYLKEKIKKLHELNFNFAIDNFGTTFPSLSALDHLPINTLKIDKQFIHDVITDFKSNIIVKALIALGTNLNISVIAEGIESEEQLQFLLAHGCTQGQGSYLSNPLSVKETTDSLKKTNSFLISIK